MERDQAASLKGGWSDVPDPPRRYQPLAGIRPLRSCYLPIVSRADHLIRQSDD